MNGLLLPTAGYLSTPTGMIFGQKEPFTTYRTLSGR